LAIYSSVTERWPMSTYFTSWWKFDSGMLLIQTTLSIGNETHNQALRLKQILKADKTCEGRGCRKDHTFVVSCVQTSKIGAIPPMPLLSQTLPKWSAARPCTKATLCKRRSFTSLISRRTKKARRFEARASLPNCYEFLILIPRQFPFSFFTFL